MKLTSSFIPVTIAFALGIAAAQYAAPLPSPPLWSIAAAATAFSLLACRFRQSLIAGVLLLIIFCLIGFKHGEKYVAPPDDPRHIANIAADNPELCLTGTLIHKPAHRDGKDKITLEVDHVLLPGEDFLVPAWGRTQLSLPGDTPMSLSPGLRYIARAKLFQTKNFGTPGVFDYKGHLATQSLFTTGWIKNQVLIQEIVGPFSTPIALKFRAIPELLRYDIEKFMDKSIEKQHLGVYKALLIGDRSSIEPERLSRYKSVGIMHLIAISGTHLGLLAYMCTILYGAVLRCSTRLMLRTNIRKVVLSLSGLTIIAYAAISGFHPPVIRSLVMVLIFLVAFLTDRPWCTMNNLAIAAMLILIFQPLSLSTASFQLSFAAAAAIILTTQKIIPSQGEKIKHLSLNQFFRKLYTGLSISISASVATAPLLLYHFNQFSLLSPFSTLAIAPFLCFWTLPAGLLAIPFIYHFPQIAEFLFQAGELGISCSEFLIAFFGRIPMGSIHLPTPFPLEIIFFYVMLMSIFFLKKTYRELTAITAAIAMITCFSIFADSQNNVIQPTVSYLDVGQGNAVVLQFPDGKTILLDGGGAASKYFNVGESIIAPFLWAKRIKTLDQIAISHPHADHYNGLAYIIKHFKPKILWHNGDPATDPFFDAVLKTALEYGAEIRRPGVGTILYKDTDITLKSVGGLHLLPPNSKKATNSDVNNRSLVLRLDCEGSSFLFPGDIERDGEKYILSQKAPIKSQVLLAPHHGHKSSGTKNFIEAVQPQYLVVSSGENSLAYQKKNSKKHQDKLFTELNTAQKGTVTFVIGKNSLTASTYY